MGVLRSQLPKGKNLSLWEDNCFVIKTKNQEAKTLKAKEKADCY